MKPTPAMALIRRMYDIVHAVLWVGLLAFVIVFGLFVAPKIPELRAQAERQRILDIAAEHHFYCEKWGMKADTHRYRQCILDLQELRTKVQARWAVESGF